LRLTANFSSAWSRLRSPSAIIAVLPAARASATATWPSRTAPSRSGISPSTAHTSSRLALSEAMPNAM
jgi:hypothetical protein